MLDESEKVLPLRSSRIIVAIPPKFVARLETPNEFASAKTWGVQSV
jgi:hypothetical protein